MAKLNFEDYRQKWETGPHWELKREFLERYQDVFPEARLLCLAQAYSNIELLHCSYPIEVMKQVHELSKSLKGWKHFRRNETVQHNDTPSGKKGKRSIEASESPNNYKFIKFCSSEDTSTKNFEPESDMPEPESGIPEPVKVENIDYLSITQSPEFKIIEKLASQVQRLGIKKTKPMDLIHSAALLLNIKKLIDLKCTIQNDAKRCSKYYVCEFYVGTTRIAVGTGNDKITAKKKASESAVTILRNLNELPTKSLVDLQDKYTEDIEKTVACDSSIVNTTGEDVNSPLSQNKSDNISNEYSKLQIQSNLEIIFLKQFAKTLKDIISPNKTGLLAINETGRRMKNIQHIVFDIFPDVSTHMHNREFICNFTIKNILISVGKSTSKKGARSEAAQSGIQYLLNLLESKGNILKSENCDSTVSNISITDKLDNESLTNSNTSRSLTLESPKTSSELLKSVNSEDMNSQISSIETSEETENRSNSINIDNISNVTKVEKNYLNVPHTCKPHSNSFILNEKLYNNSIKQQMLLFQSSESSLSSPGAILSYSMQQSRKQYRYEIETDMNKKFKASIIIDKNVFASGVGLTKEIAKKEAAINAIEKLRKEVYTIKVKTEEEDGYVISRSQLINFDNPASNAVSENNIGCKMLKMMGWSGGGIGKTGGIIEPVTVKDHSFGTGLGYADEGISKMNVNKFSHKVECLLRDFNQSKSATALLFSTEFSKAERKLIHQIATKYHLYNNSVGRDEARQLCIKRKITISELLNLVVKSGGSTNKYELVDMSL